MAHYLYKITFNSKRQLKWKSSISYPQRINKQKTWINDSKVYQEDVADGRGWVDSRKIRPIFSRNLSSLVTIRPVRDSSAGHFGQVVVVDISDGRPSAVASSNAVSLTHGKFEVVQIIGWDEDNHFV